jgi:copper(I)-binding protein
MTPAGYRGIGCALMVILAVGCGSDVEATSSNRGASDDNQATSIDNAYIVPAFVPGSCALQQGDIAQLRFTITNNRPVKEERLLSVTTDAAARITVPDAVTLDIGPGGSLTAGEFDAASDGSSAVRLVGLRPAVKPAGSVPVTFRFKEFGNITLRVPVEACPLQKQ